MFVWERAFGVMAVVALYIGSIQDYQSGRGFAAWLTTARPACCIHCLVGKYEFWSSYPRWVYIVGEQMRIVIKRVRCVACGVTDALLPSFLHMHRRYAIVVIQETVTLALESGTWSDELVDAVAPNHGRPAASTIRRWVWSFALSAETWLVVWLERTLLILDPWASLDLGQPPVHLLNIANDKRSHAFIQGWQALRLAEKLYVATKAHQPNLVFEAKVLFAFLTAALGAIGRPPRILWPQGAARAPT